MAHYIVQLRDMRTGRDAYCNIDVPKVNDPELAALVIQEDLADAQFVIADISPVLYVPIQAAGEMNVNDFMQKVGEA